MDRYEQDDFNERESDRLRQESDLSGHTTSRRPDYDDRQHADALHSSGGHSMTENENFANEGFDTSHEHGIDEPKNYVERTRDFDTEGYSSVRDTTSSAFETPHSEGIRSYDSAETRFGVEHPEHHTTSGVGGEGSLASHDPSFTSGQAGRDDTYSSIDTTLNKPSHTGPYGGSEDRSHGEATTTGYEDTSSKSSDSTMGQLMEKAGDMLNKEDLAEKGREKRHAAGYDQSE